MVNTSNIEKAIKAAASDPKQKKLSFFINAVAPVGHAASKSSRKSPDGSPAHTGVPPSTPPPAPTPASLPPTAHPTTSAPTTPDSQKIQPMVAPSAPVKPVSKAPTKLQRKKARIRACLKCDPCPCPSNICSSEAGTHIPARDQKEVAYTSIAHGDVIRNSLQLGGGIAMTKCAMASGSSTSMTCQGRLHSTTSRQAL